MPKFKVESAEGEKAEFALNDMYYNIEKGKGSIDINFRAMADGEFMSLTITLTAMEILLFKHMMKELFK